jgi:predicted nuclease of predicted toxin-antitoxin system
LIARLGPPPAIILLTCGNTSTAFVQNLLSDQFAAALQLIAAGEPLVEIGR